MLHHTLHPVCQWRAPEGDGRFTEEAEMVRGEPTVAGQGLSTADAERCGDCTTHGEVATSQNWSQLLLYLMLNLPGLLFF